SSKARNLSVEISFVPPSQPIQPVANILDPEPHGSTARVGLYGSGKAPRLDIPSQGRLRKLSDGTNFFVCEQALVGLAVILAFHWILLMRCVMSGVIVSNRGPGAELCNWPFWA